MKKPVSKPLNLKPEFTARMEKLLAPADFDRYKKILNEPILRSIRCNTLKISTQELKERLESKGWKIKQPWPKHPEIMIVENDLEPGELGRALEHLLGYYYIQELASLLPAISLNPQSNEFILDLAAAPGSKTTQISSYINNTGTIIANEISFSRIKILASNLERCGCSNTIITKKEGSALCQRLKKQNYLFDKILLDAPCSGEGTLRSTPKTSLMWNPKTIKSVSRLQKTLITSALEILKSGGILVYSTCTHAPEENEEVIDFALKKFSNIKLETINLPVKTREGITNWQDQIYNSEVKKCARIYPQDNNTEGFFIAKLRKIK